MNPRSWTIAKEKQALMKHIYGTCPPMHRQSFGLKTRSYAWTLGPSRAPLRLTRLNVQA